MRKIFLLRGDAKSECLEVLTSYIMPALKHKACILVINEKEKKALSLENVPCIIYEDTMISDSDKLVFEVCRIAEVDTLILKEPKIWPLAKLFYLESTQMEPTVILAKLKDKLSISTFLFTPHITLADIFAAVPAIKALQQLSGDKVMEWLSVYRWAEYLLNLPYIGDILYDKTGGLRSLESLISEEDLREDNKSVDKTSKREELKAKKKKAKEKGKEKAKKEAETVPFAQLDIRVGRIVKVDKHPDSAKLYIEEVDVGGEVRKIASGLQGLMQIEELLNRNVVVLCNLKPKSIAGYMSHGMVLCASNKDQSAVELLTPPENSKPGDVITVDNIEPHPIDEVNLSKHGNPWKKVEPSLTTAEDLTVTLDGKPLKTAAGVISVTSLKSAHIN
eukprot:TRINITY_DN9727_c0_g1_i1.p1 TRINITY_DN9727_c0_g1~~TRINITY_DN9727_c0_g1_i1.p1  ORF type:complete len:391 (-),score=72.29 TRINITY_DN9727_c0_g1_i1:116-1288(-)